MKNSGKMTAAVLAAAMLFSVNNAEALQKDYAPNTNSYNNAYGSDTYNNNNADDLNPYSMEQHITQMVQSHEREKLRKQFEERQNDLKHQWKQDEAVNNSYHKEKRRFFNIYKDSVFSYYLDQPTARWKLCPYMSDEYILDVWIAIFDNDDLQKLSNNEITSIGKYYLEHYYIRPKTKQIQFLCELEVSRGRPENNIRERKYLPRNWENLVPGSIEDSIYHHTLRNVRKYNLAQKSDRENDSVNYFLDRLHIITSSIAEGIGLYI